jgi:DNA-binding CsgD family transcriptional regulator
MSSRRDPIALVEACYDLGASEQAWLRAIARATGDLVQRSQHGVIAYHVELAADGMRIESPVQAGGDFDVAGRLGKLAALLERTRSGEASLVDTIIAKVYQRVVQGGLRAPVDRLMMSEFDKLGPDWMYTLGVPGVRDHFTLINHHIDGLGATFVVAGLSQRVELRPAERQMFQMLGAHIKAGLRLRRQLGGAAHGVHAPEGGAVLDASSRVVHAEGDAREATAQDELHQSAQRIDCARTAHAGRDAAALEVWQGLVQGRWSLVERFDADGKRFMLAYCNPESITDPRGLTRKESRVTGLAVRGYANKLIAYHLGISEGTVSTHLHNAMRKLGIASRVELVRTLGTHYPQSTDPRHAS